MKSRFSRIATPLNPRSGLGLLRWGVSTVLLLTCLLTLWAKGNLILEWGKWYSYHPALRLQVEAFLAGQLHLGQDIRTLHHDWAWNDGLYQLWGLGVPLLRLPFDIVAKLFGSIGFPDRILIFFIFSCSVLALYRGLVSVIDTSKKNTQVTDIFLAAVLTALTCLSPTFFTILNTRFAVYEEVVFIGMLWALLIAGLNLLFIVNPSDRRWQLLCAIAGFAVFIRPTGIIYALSAIVCAALCQATFFNFKKLIQGALIFASLVSLLLLANYLRFGSPFEFGYSLNLSNLPRNDFALRFKAAIQSVPIPVALEELFGAIFFSDPIPKKLGLFAKDAYPWHAPVIRFREYYFSSLGTKSLALLLLSLFIFSLAALKPCRKIRAIIEADPRTRPLFFFGALNFLLLFFFYLYSPSITSRYLMDFYVAFACIVLAGAIATYRLLESIPYRGFKRWIAPSLICIGICFTAHQSYHLHPPEKFYKYAPRGANAKSILHSISRWKKSVSQYSQMPNRYYCDPHKKFGGISVPGGNATWKTIMKGICQRKSSTTLFFPPFECLEVVVDEPSGEPFTSQELSERLALIQAKVGIRDIPLESVNTKGKRSTLRFCLDDEALSSKPTTSTQLVTIGWAQPDTMKLIHPGLISREFRSIRSRNKRVDTL